MPTPTPWSASELISVAPSDSRGPAATLVGEVLHLFWTKDKVIYHATRTADAWSDPVRVAAGEQPSVVATPDGRLHCLFAHDFAEDYDIFYTCRESTGWSLPEPISRTSGDSLQPALAVAADGMLHATWTDTTPGYATTYHGQYHPVAWSNAPIPNGRGSAPSIATAPNGDLFIAWQDRNLDTGRYEIFCAIRRGAKWSLPYVISNNPNCHSLQPKLSTNVQGDCHAVWQEEAGGIYRVRHAGWFNGGWTKPVDVSSAEADCRGARIAAIRQGLHEVIWVEGQGLKHRVRPADRDTTWWAGEIAPGSYAGLTDLALAISRGGRVHVVSCQVEAGVRRLYYTQREPLFKHTVFVPVG